MNSGTFVSQFSRTNTATWTLLKQFYDCFCKLNSIEKTLAMVENIAKSVSLVVFSYYGIHVLISITFVLNAIKLIYLGI